MNWDNDPAIQKQLAADRLRELCWRGTDVYCVLEHVSQSGMARDIKLFVVHDSQILHISHYVGLVTGYKRRKNRDGLRINGCGMDMGFALVSDLSYALYGDSYQLNHRWL